jgi:threonine/homoserine/homoserine lactone efflux protein
VHYCLWPSSKGRLLTKADEQSGKKEFLKGIVLAISNPINFLTWSGIVFILKTYNLNKTIEIIHLFSIILVIFIAQIFSTLGSPKLDFQNKHLFKFKIALTGILILAGIKVLIDER